MRENRLYGSEGGGAACRSPYPYPNPTEFLAAALGNAERRMENEELRARLVARGHKGGTVPGKLQPKAKERNRGIRGKLHFACPVIGSVTEYLLTYQLIDSANGQSPTAISSAACFFFSFRSHHQAIQMVIS